MRTNQNSHTDYTSLVIVYAFRKLDIRQRLWVELVGDYRCDIAIILERDDASQEARRAQLSIRGPFKILDRIGPIAYYISLPSELSNVHDVSTFLT